MKIKNLINLTKLAALSLGLFIVSCTAENFETIPDSSSNDLVEKYFMGDLIKVEDLGDGSYRLDDMLFAPGQLSDNNESHVEKPVPGESIAKLGLAGGIRKWPNNTVIYVLDNSLTSNQIRVTDESMAEWTSKTNVKFKERTNENYYVTIKNDGRNCNCGRANLGVNGNRGSITIGTRTSPVVMIHEIGHTLGYVHEQTRSDRDQFVIINFDNIQAGAESQFRRNDRAQLIGAFDIKSTMMYGSYTFSKNGQPTIVEKSTGQPYPRRRAELSAGDIAGTNQVYPGNGGGDGGGGNTDSCEGVDEWVAGQQYNVGDRVTYRGFLYERDFTRWNRILECDATPSGDICEGVAAYSRGTNYSPGAKVTYRGFLYELQSNFRWSNQGQCGN